MYYYKTNNNLFHFQLWSPYEMPKSKGNRDKVDTTPSRLLCSKRSCRQLDSPGEPNTSRAEDSDMLHFFDSLLYEQLNSTTIPIDIPKYNFDGTNARRYDFLIRRKRRHLLDTMVEKSRHQCSFGNVDSTTL